MNEKIDINYIAKMANVSRSTVSRVLTKKPNVKPETRKKVEAIMDELNYHPNSLARGLATGRQNIIGLVISDIRNPFYAELVWTISCALKKRGYLMTLYNSSDTDNNVSSSLWSLLDYGLSGLIMADATNDKHFNQFLKSAGCPILLVNRSLDSNNSYDTITLDNFKGGYIATKHLIDLGHTKIAMAKGPSVSNTSQKRYEGYLRALEEAGIPFNSSYIYSGELDMDFGRSFAKKIINSDNPPTAVFGGGDYCSYGIMDECIRNGIRIPEDLSIVSFDDIPISSTAMIDLTSVSHSYNQIGELVARKIVNRINNPLEPIEQVSIIPKLVLRGSTCKFR